MSHIHHPDSHEHGLCDDCPECQAAILYPAKLDRENLQRIWMGKHHTETDCKVHMIMRQCVLVTDTLLQAFGAPPNNTLWMIEASGREEVSHAD